MNPDFYIRFPDCLEFYGHALFKRDWVRILMLLGPSGGLTPPEAKDWITHNETRDGEWHRAFDTLERYLAVVWQCDMIAERPLPFHLQKWVLQKTDAGCHHWSDYVDLFDLSFVEARPSR